MLKAGLFCIGECMSIDYDAISGIDAGVTNVSSSDESVDEGFTKPPKSDLDKYFRALFPEFSDFDDIKIYIQIETAKGLVSKDVWGDMYTLGVSLIAAHRLTLQNLTSGSGSINLDAGRKVSSKSVAGVSVSYEATASVTGDTGEVYWNSTPYGREYLYLRSLFGQGVISL